MDEIEILAAADRQDLLAALARLLGDRRICVEQASKVYHDTQEHRRRQCER